MLTWDWDAKFRNWMRKGLEFRKGELPIVPDPLPPKVPMPPCPPPHPDVIAAGERYAERVKAGEKVDLRSLFKPTWVLPPLPDDCVEDAVG
jgi:hypothetical protein